MIRILRTDSGHPDFAALVKLLDADLAARDGDEHAFYAQFNTIVHIKYAVVAYANEEPVACGAIKEFASDTVEVKRMFTVPTARGQGVAAQVLRGLERWAAELSYQQCVLETGKRQTEAIRLYEKSGYQRIPNYGQYAHVANSLCFAKKMG
jgi:putative acetyltransferase